jgi:hypothetical protein
LAAGFFFDAVFGAALAGAFVAVRRTGAFTAAFGAGLAAGFTVLAAVVFTVASTTSPGAASA